MQTILQTKLHKPTPSAQTILRERVCSLLDASLRCRLTLVSAPPGYGKTTAVAQWLELRPAVLSVWLSLDPADNDPVRFFVHLLSGLQTHLPQTVMPLLELLHSTQMPEVNIVVTSLVNRLVAQEQPVVIVLDDYHTIEQRTIHEAVQHLLDYAPSTLHMIIITRADPPLALARRRSRNHLLEVRMNDLRFQQTETTHFFDRDGGRTLLNTAQVAQITDRTEGWVAALQLVELSLQSQTDVDTFVEKLSGAQRHIVDYLVDEVLAHLPDAITHFLFQTAALQRLCAPLCQALTGREDSQQILEYLERTNLFLVPLDDERRWYRYHHLFAQFLLNRQGSAAVKAQHLLAVDWHLEQGYTDQALQHAFAAGAVEQALHIMDSVFQSLLAEGKLLTLLRYYAQIPDAALNAHPARQIRYAVALLSVGDAVGAAHRLMQAEQQLARFHGDDSDRWRGWVAAVHALLESRDLRADETRHFVRQALALLPEDDRFVRAAVLFAECTVLDDVLDQPQQALQTIDAAIHMAEEANHTALAINLLYRRGALLRILGQFDESLATFQRTLLHFKDKSELSILLTSAYDGLALTLLEQHRLADAMAIYTPQRIALIDDCGIAPIQMPSLMTRAALAAAQDDFVTALHLMDHAYRIAERLSHRAALSAVTAQRATILLASGQPEAAYAWAAQYEVEVSPAARSAERKHLFDTIMWTGILLHQHRYDELLELLTPMITRARDAGRITHEIELRLTQALAHHARGDVHAACTALRIALNQALPLRYVRVFLNHKHFGVGALLRDCQQDVCRNQDEQAFLGDILREMGGSHVAVQSRPKTDLEPLTKREAEILYLIDRGLTNQEIADRLVISLGTVKKHISNVFLKLNAQNRTQALSRAREYDLLT